MTRKPLSRKEAGSIAGALLIYALVIGISAGLVQTSRVKLRVAQAKINQLADKHPPIYLPSTRYVRLITLGYDNFASDILWFKTLSYFGKHIEGDKDFRWLGHMCDLVTSLDNKSRHAFDFCSTLLSWVAREPEKSKELLLKAVEAEPDYWRYHYLLGFTYWYFLEDRDSAKTSLTKASKLPGAPTFVAALASRLLVAQDAPQLAVDFLREFIRNTSDPNAKRALKRKLRRAVFTRDIEVLRTAINTYEERYGRKLEHLDELVQGNILRKLPVDPRRKPYSYNPATGEISSPTGYRPLGFGGKTFKTSFGKKEAEANSAKGAQ